MNRRLISAEEIADAIEKCTAELYMTLEKKGYLSFSSIHEIAGTLEEEIREMWDAVRKDGHTDIKEELKDIATVCIFGIACIEAGGVDW